MPINVDNSRSKQEKGVWTSFGGSKFKVVHAGAAKFQRVLNRLQAPYRKKIERGTLDPVISKEILAEAMAEGMLIDWADVVNSQNEEVPFDSDMAKVALLNNDDLREYL
jgi:hypothetical protein